MATTRGNTRPALVTDLRKLLAQPNPSIPLYFDSTLEKMTVFRNAVNAYVTSGQTEINRRQEKHKNVIRREQEKVVKMNAEIEQFRVDEMNLMKTLKREQEEKAEAEAKLAEYNAQLKDVEENRAAVNAELEDLRSRTEKLKLEKSQDIAKLEHQVGLNEPEAHALNDVLKWSVESVQRDVLCITFTHIDTSDWTREFSFVLDLSEKTYKVTTSTPLLPQMSALVDWLNETGEFYWFVKKVGPSYADRTRLKASRCGWHLGMATTTVQVSNMDSSTLPKATRKATSPAQPLQQPFPHHAHHQQHHPGYGYTPSQPGYYYPQPGYPQGYFAQTPDQQQQQQFAQWAFQQMMYNSQQQQQPHAMPGVPDYGQRTRTGSGAGQEYGGYPQQMVAMGFQSGTPPPPPMHYGSIGRAAGTDHQGFHPYRRPGGSVASQPPPPQPQPQARTANQELGFQPYMHPGYPQPPRPYAREMNGSASSLHSNGSGSRQRTGSNPRAPTGNSRHGRNQSVGSSVITTATSARDRSVTPPAKPASPVSPASPTAVMRPVKPSPLSQPPFADKRLSRDDSTLEAPHAALPRTNGLKGRLRRALSFSAIQTLDEADEGKEKLGSRRKAIEKANKANAALQKQQDGVESPGAPESIRTTASKKPSRGLFNRRLNASTDNISLQSTVSSASVMIRKLGSMGNIARRNSLAGLTGLFKDKKDKKEKESAHKADVSEPSVTHATVEVDRVPGPSVVGTSTMDDMTGLSPAAKLARQHTLKSNAQAAERAKQEAQAAAEAAAAAEANRVEEEDEEESEEAFDPAAHMTGGFDDEDITVRLERTKISQDDEVWAVGIRRSVERAKKPVKGILRNAVNFNQEIYLDKDNAPSLRQRSNSETNQVSHPGPLARIPSPDPDHIDGLRSGSPHDTIKSTFSADFGEFTTPSLALTEKHSTDRGGPFTYTHPALNSSAPVLSTINNTPNMAQRSATAPGRRRLTFATNLSVYDTFAPSTYDRRSEPATCNRLTPALAQRIKEELNSYKMEEMEVHASSRIHTHFFA
ncbi:chromosome segregation protein spc25 [Rhizoctonia solani AG-3 Rhs1AP]|nr:chromosome segregation protein spc25 [Rhizoctonia solani AG-3 Rhs1AP]